MAVVCSVCLWRAPWAAVRSVPARLHLILGGAVLCLVLWLMSVRVVDGLLIHFLGITAFTLLVGLRFALLAGALASACYVLLMGQSVAAIPVAWWLSVCIPAMVSRSLVTLISRLGFSNLFVFMLGTGFVGGILAMLCMSIAALLLLWLGGQQAWVEAALENWPIVTLALFPEGFINGMIVTTLTVFFPQLVKNFDDETYLGRKE